MMNKIFYFLPLSAFLILTACAHKPIYAPAHPLPDPYLLSDEEQETHPEREMCAISFDKNAQLNQAQSEILFDFARSVSQEGLRYITVEGPGAGSKRGLGLWRTSAVLRALQLGGVAPGRVIFKSIRGNSNSPWAIFE